MDAEKQEVNMSTETDHESYREMWILLRDALGRSIDRMEKQRLGMIELQRIGRTVPALSATEWTCKGLHSVRETMELIEGCADDMTLDELRESWGIEKKQDQDRD